MSNKLFVVCGEPGVGKSKIANHIAGRVDGKCLSTDKIRKDLFGPDPEYTRKESQATYDEMFDQARNFLKRGETVVLDATFMFAAGRERANRLAQEHTDPYNFTIVRVTADESVALQRIRDRNGVSDATVDVYHSIRDRFESVELPHVKIDNSDWWFSTKKRMRDKDLYESPSYYST